MSNQTHKNPQFSVLIPAYNAQDTVRDTIASVQNQQGSIPFEIIVVNDGSTDATLLVLQAIAESDSRVKVISQHNAGSGAALQTAAKRAQGEFLVQLGADDFLAPNYMARTAQAMERIETYDIYSSNAYRLFEDGSTQLYFQGEPFDREFSLTFEDLIAWNKIYGTAAIRRSLFEKAGGFRPQFYNEDYDLWLRLLLAGARHLYLPEPLAYYRVIEGQKTQSTIKVRQGDIAILRDLKKSPDLSRNIKFHLWATIKQLQLKIVIKRLLGRA